MKNLDFDGFCLRKNSLAGRCRQGDGLAPEKMGEFLQGEGKIHAFITDC